MDNFLLTKRKQCEQCWKQRDSAENVFHMDMCSKLYTILVIHVEKSCKGLNLMRLPSVENRLQKEEHRLT